MSNAHPPSSAPAPPAAVPASSTPNIASVLALQIGVVVVAALYLAREVLIPIIVAILLCFVLGPLVDLLRRIRLGRVPSVLVAVVLALAVIVAVGGVIGSQVAELATKAPEYAVTVEKKVETLRAYTVGRISALADRLGHGGSSEGEATRASPAPEAGSAPRAAAPPAPGTTTASSTTPLGLMERYLSPVLSPIATLGIIVVVAIFALLQKEDLRDRFIRLFGATDLHRTTVAMDDAGRRLSRYFLTQLGINASFGIIIGAGLYFIGVPNPVLWAILSALLRFVPYIGSFISAALPIVLATAVDPGWSMAIWTAALYVVVELLVSQAVEPVLYGHSTGLSPFAVVVCAIFWSWLWGPVGLILSMPLTLCLVVLGRHVDRLEFLDVLLGDRPPLTPVESFYQRILAGDADEAEDHAELLLKERSLSSYYDEVALKGLQLAANDAERGVLHLAQLERIKTTINLLVKELDRHEDVEPPPEESDDEAAGVPKDERELPKRPPPDAPAPDHAELAPDWRGQTPVLCLAGKGPLDEAASGMLIQLLGKHGLGARLAPYEAASREGIASLDVDGIAMVCISYLDISGSPSHLRYLLRRLREKLPGAPILVGLWPSEDSVLKDDRARAALGADYYTTSLREAVEACLAAASKEAGTAPVRAGPAGVAAP